MKFHDLLSPHGIHVNARCGSEKNFRFSKILEISIFKFIFGISLCSAVSSRQGVVKGENKIFKKGGKIRFFNKRLEIDIFKFRFGISLKKSAIQVQTRPCSDKHFVNPPVCLISFLAFRIEFASSRRIGCFLRKIAKIHHFNFLRLHGLQENYNFGG